MTVSNVLIAAGRPTGVPDRYLPFVADIADSPRGTGAVEAAALAHAPELREGTALACTGGSCR